MCFFPSMSIALVALFASSVAGLGLRSGLAKKLQLAAELGLDVNAVVKNQDPVSFRAMIAESTDSSVPAEYVSIPIDHDNPSVGTYRNRYWVNDAYYTPGGPVILYDVGEVNGEYSAGHLTNRSSMLRSLLQEFNAIGIVWEHRYYGESLPYPVGNNTPPEHWMYLTTAQALADIPYFAENFTRPAYSHFDLTPESTPWVMVGGSYPGIRAALMRNEYPDTIFAAYASSAPIQAQIDMSVYYEQIYRAMLANGHENCARDIQAALEWIDGQLAQEDTATVMKQLFFGPGAEKNTNEDFTAALAGIFGYVQTHGFGGPRGSLGEFCSYLETDPDTGVSAGYEGLAPSRGNKFLAEHWAAWPLFTQVVNDNMFTNCQGLNRSSEPICKLNPSPIDPDGIAWTWQYCSEWGFYQSNNVGVGSLLSNYQTLEYQQFQCNRLFPAALKSGILPSEPRVTSLNSEHGGWAIRPSNVFWTAGEFDPWRTLSPLSNESFAPQGIKATTDIPQCGVKTPEDTIFGYVGANMYHCFDFHDSQAATESRKYFNQALKQWLPCFEKQKQLVNPVSPRQPARPWWFKSP
ncbi:serine carboxypeptidase S28-domain-containing protein [Aspergillus pseudoustus]|uniref:Serine carboxypeptidase S28-domain-containing protein n=1 Tax=Aspergillus pseudoustus TaxID=1810923 RepID=A0ABR4KC06_9EURO